MGPTAMATLAMAVHRPMALALAFGSGKAALTRASDVTLATAAPAPCTPRATLRKAMLGARPQATDATVNTTRPTRKTRLRPCRSATVAPDMMKMAMQRL